jgi:hypothetical protein
MRHSTVFLSMTIADIIKRVKLGVDRAEYAEGDAVNPADAGYLQVVNEAQREICEAYNWSFMHDIARMDILWNRDWATLPSGVKALNGRNPITLLSQDFSFEFPVTLVTREQFIQRKPRMGSFAQLPVPGQILLAPEQELFAYISWNELLQLEPLPPPAPPPEPRWGNVIHLPGVISTTVQRWFNVDCFKYLPDFFLINDLPYHLNERNGLTDGFPEMLIAKAKSIALAGVNDSLAGDLDALYQSKFRSAKQADSHRMATAVKLRM